MSRRAPDEEVEALLVLDLDHLEMSFLKVDEMRMRKFL